nr:rho GTPase-activating protein conundrum isoform X2 [Halyomorpha halys]
MAHEDWPWSSTSCSGGSVSAMAGAKITTTILRIKLSLHLKSLSVYGECSDERDWLAAAGLSEVTEPAFLSGREVPEAELTRALRLLSRQQAAAVRRRVDSLNKTVRQRARARQRGDIRQLFKDVESWSNDSRSRSATPDSLDSGPPTPPSPPRELYNPQPQSLQLTTDHPRLTSSAVNRHESRQRLVSPHTPFSSHHSLFRRASRSGGDVASETADGIRMTGYQRIGSVRVRFGSDPINISNIGQDNQHPMVCVTRSDEGLFSDSSRRDSGDSAHSDTLGFEEMWAGERLCSSLNEMERDWEEGTGRTWVDFLAEEDLNTLKPLVFLELTALMDHSGLRVGKTKPPKRKRKEDGNIFGVSLSTLLERDRQIVQEPHNVPLVFQKVLGELERRCLWEEGLLRMGGNRTRCETLAAGLERDFYRRPEVADHLISTAAPHDLACVLKKLLRELPQPLLTSQLLHTFYQAHCISECSKALNLLVLLLPTEHRATLHALLTFLSSLAGNSDHNKMSVQNIAMIMAPSLFPPDILVDKAGLKAELGLAVHCCSLTELLITATDRLWLVPDNLIAQLRSINESHKENKPKPRLLARKGHVASRKAAGESEFEGNMIHVDSPQFLVAPLPISLDKHITAAHVILRAVELARDAPRLVKSTRREMKSRALSELAPNGNLSCLLSTGDPDTALRTHFLYEVGGNIGQRRLEPSVKLWAVYQNNPRAQWVIRCDHRNGSQRLLRRL